MTPSSRDSWIEQLPEGVARDRIDARGGLVEDQHVRSVDHRDRERQALADAEREPLGERVGDLAESEARDHLVDARRDAIGGQVEDVRVQLEVLAHRQLAVEREALRHEADPLAGLDVARVDRTAEEQRLAVAARQQAGQHLHRGGLAAAVRAQEAEDLAALDAEADVVDGGEVAEAAREPARLDGRRAVVVDARRDAPASGGRGASPPAAARRTRARGSSRPPSRIELRGRAGREHAPGIHRDEPVEALGLLHVRRGDQHAHAGAARADAVDELPELAPRRAGPRRWWARRGSADRGRGSARSRVRASASCRPRACPRGRSANGASPVLVEQLRDAPRALRAALPEQAPEEVDVVAHRQRRGRDSVRAPAACRRPAGAGCGGDAPSRMSPPSTSTVPSWILRTPATRPSSVDLPTPSGPMKPTIEPPGTSRSTRSSATVAP